METTPKDQEQMIQEAAEKDYPEPKDDSLVFMSTNKIFQDMRRAAYITGVKSECARQVWEAKWDNARDAIKDPPTESGEYLGLVKSYESYANYVVFWRSDRRTYEVYGCGRREPVIDMNVIKWMPLPSVVKFYND